MTHQECRRLHAEWYDLVTRDRDQTPETDFWARCIEEAGEPALELGCGTGRTCVRLLERGYDITGIDNSDDMLARCRAKCQAKGLKADLHEQSMLDFVLPREFGLIYLNAQGLDLFTSDEAVRAVFVRVMAHLKPGGMFAYGFATQVGHEYSRNDGIWNGDWLNADDHITMAWRERNRFDESRRIWTRMFVLEKFVDGRLTETEANERTGRCYPLEDGMSYAASAGFINVRATEGLTDNPATPDSPTVIVRCHKPA